MPIRSWVIVLLTALGIGLIYRAYHDLQILGWGCFLLALVYGRLTGRGGWL